MTSRCMSLFALVWLVASSGCTSGPAPSGGAGGEGGNGSGVGTGAAAIVGRVTASPETARLLTAQVRGCPVVEVTVNGTPVDLEFDDDCTFLITGVQPSELVEVRVELVDLGVAGTVELSDVLDDELIEILVQPGRDSLTISVERRTAPEPTVRLPEVIEDNDVSIRLPAGVFRQNLTVLGNDFTLVGEAGEGCNDSSGWTVIDGEVVVNGNHATFRNILFAGPVELHGRNARFINCCFGDELIVFGDGSDDDDDDDDDDEDDDDDDDDDDDRAPRLTCPTNLIVECDGDGNDAEFGRWLASASVESTCDGLVISDNFSALDDDCGATGHVVVTWSARDECGRDSCQATFTIVDETAPSISGPGDLAFDCDESGTQTELLDWLDSATGDDSCGDVLVTFDRESVDFDCSATIRWTSADECGNTATHSAELTIEGDETAPALTRIGAAELVLECGVEAYVELGASVTDTCDATITVEIGGDEVDDRTPGAYVVTYDASDLCGHEATRQFRSITVEDTLGPTATSRGRELWPPNHDDETLTLAECALVVDACEGELDANAVGRIRSIYSDEPDDADGDGNTTGDIVIVDEHTFRVRSERQGGGNGRVYGVSFTVTDSAGNTADGECFVSVPHDQSGRDAVDDGPAAGHVVP